MQKAFEVNAFAVRRLAEICSHLKCVFVHVSTDYVFGGEKCSPYSEEDLPNPQNVYGASKLAGEYLVKSICSKYFVVRTSGLYGAAGSGGKGGNFVESMVRLAKENRSIRVVSDQIVSPTYSRDLALTIKGLLQTDDYGIYHATNGGQCSWYEFAAKIFELLHLEPNFNGTTASAYGAKARRPAYSVLANAKLKSIGIDNLRFWPEALEDYLVEKKHQGPRA